MTQMNLIKTTKKCCSYKTILKNRFKLKECKHSFTNKVDFDGEM